MQRFKSISTVSASYSLEENMKKFTSDFAVGGYDGH